MAFTTNTVLTGTVSGRNGAGSVTLTGAQVGDIVITASSSLSAIEFQSAFESVVSVADELQQTNASNLTGISFTTFLFRPATIVCCISA